MIFNTISINNTHHVLFVGRKNSFMIIPIVSKVNQTSMGLLIKNLSDSFWKWGEKWGYGMGMGTVNQQT